MFYNRVNRTKGPIASCEPEKTRYINNIPYFQWVF